MKTPLILTFLVLNTFRLNAQLSKFVLIDGVDKTPVRYANIKSPSNDFGTSSDSLGNFFFEKKSQVLINAVGYEKAALDLTNNNSPIELTPKEKLIQEVIVYNRKNQHEILIDELKTSKINQYYGLSGKQNSSWIIGKFFENKTYKTKFVKTIRILTKSNVQNSIFNVRIYSVDNYGTPLNEIYHQNIIGIAKKGTHKTEVDLSFTNLIIPENGIFIALDWIKTEKNLYKYTYRMENSSEKLLGKSYSPSFGTYLSLDKNETQILRENGWKPAIKDMINKSNSYAILAMELTLTD